MPCRAPACSVHVSSCNKALALRLLLLLMSLLGSTGGAGRQVGFAPSPTRKGRAETQQRAVADTAHMSCFVTSHLFDREQGSAWGEGRSRWEQQLRPDKQPPQASRAGGAGATAIRWAGKNLKPPFPLKVSPDTGQGPSPGWEVSPWPWRVPPGTTRAQTEHRPLLQQPGPSRRAKLPLAPQTGSAEAGTVFIASNRLLRRVCTPTAGDSWLPPEPQASPHTAPCIRDPCRSVTRGRGSITPGPRATTGLCPCSQGKAPASRC